MQYPYECENCGTHWTIHSSMADRPKQRPHCPHCGKAKTRRVWTTPAMLVKGSRKGEDLFNPALPGRNQAEDLETGIIHRTPEQQEQHYKKVIAEKRHNARMTALARKGSRRKDGELRHVASVPTELFRAAQRHTGDQHCWKHGGKRMLKKHGLYFED